MVRVRGHAVADQLRVDLGAARPRVLQLLEHDHAAGLAHHEAVAPRVERPGRALRVVVPARERPHRAEAGDADARDPRLGAAAEHHVRTAEPDRVGALADRHVRRGAGGALRRERPARAELHRDPAGAHVRDDRRDRERVHAVGAALDERSGSSPGTSPGRRSRSRSTRRRGRLRSRCRARSRPPPAAPPRRTICAKRSIRRACFRSIHSVGSKSFSSQAKWTGNSCASNCVISAAPDFAGEQVLPRRLDVVAERRHHAEAGDDDPPSPVHAHVRHIPSPPSTSSTSPVMNEAASEQRKRTAPATSSGSPSRPSGVVCEHRAGRLLRQHVREPRLHVAGRDDVRAHVPRAELARERLREADDPGLRGGVVRLARVAVHADDRGDVHDRAGARFIIGRVTARQV